MGLWKKKTCVCVPISTSSIYLYWESEMVRMEMHGHWSRKMNRRLKLWNKI